MDKPEELKQLARTIVLVCQYTWPKDREKNVQKAEKLLETFVSEAVLSAQSQAYIDAARIANEAHDWAKAEYEKDPNDGPFVLRGSIATSKAISAAILQRKEEMK